MKPLPQLGAMLRLAAPMMVINLSMTAMQFCDTAMVAPLGSNALAAVLPAGLIYFVPFAFWMGVLSSVGTFIAQSLGRNEKSECGHYAWQGIFFAAAAGLSMLGFWPLAPLIFEMFGHAKEVRELEIVFFQICLFGALPGLIGMVFSNFFVSIQRPAILAWYAVGSTLLNIFLNYGFIYGKMGFPEMGVAGSALGTVLSITAQTLGLAIHFYLAKEFGTRRARFEFAALKRILRIGLPSGFEIGFDILSWGVALVWMVGLFGTAHLAATTIIVRYMHLSFMPALALASAMAAMVGKAIGENRKADADQIVKVGLGATVVFMALMGVIFFLFRETFLGWFTADPEIIRIGSGILLLVAIFQIFDACMIIYSHALRAAGDTLWQATVMISTCLIIFFGGGMCMVTFFPELTSIGPWLTGTVYIFTVSGLLGWRWWTGRWRKVEIFAGA